MQVTGPLKALFASHGSTLQGGAEQTLLELSVALEADGRVSPVVTVPARGALSQALAEGGVATRVVETPLWTPFSLTPFGASTPLGRIKRRAQAVGETVMAAGGPWRRLLREVQPDVVVTNTVAIASPAFSACLVGLPHVWWIHEFTGDGHALHFPLGNGATYRIIGALSDRVIVTSRAVESAVSPPISEDRITVIHPTVPSPPDQRREPRGAGLRLLVLGAQHRHKGGQLAIEALARLTDAPGTSLRLVGWISDAYRDELQALSRRLGVADRVEIQGGTDEPYAELARADVLLMCSRAEPFGRVTAEALKCGTPVVGFRSGGTPEIVADGVDGLLVDPGSVDALTSAIGRLVHDRQLLRRLGAQAAERNQDRFSLAEATDRTVQALLDASRGPSDGPHREGLLRPRSSGRKPAH